MSESFISNYFMERAIELARKGGGKVHPNPLVGAVIVRNGKIVTEGFHHEYGNLHAERDALKNARENNSGTLLSPGKAAAMYSDCH